MDTRRLKEEWEALAPRWIKEVREGGNSVRKGLIDPVMLKALGNVEGFIGGILGCMLAIVIYGMWMQTKNVWIPWYSYVFLGAVLGFVSQTGDWFASCIKRYLEIKDFGKIMPGHGGVLDRFDSILFAAPFVYIFILLF
jgi:CDP-diglyceride synthetase